jgi:hypothetical protein
MEKSVRFSVELTYSRVGMSDGILTAGAMIGAHRVGGNLFVARPGNL